MRGRPVILLLSAEQTGAYKRAEQFLTVLLQAKELLADRGYGADWFREALRQKGIPLRIRLIKFKNSNTIKVFISSATKSKTCLSDFYDLYASQHTMIIVLIFTFRPYVGHHYRFFFTSIIGVLSLESGSK